MNFEEDSTQSPSLHVHLFSPALPARTTLPTRLVTSASSRPADSDAPIASVDVASLSCGRFLLQKQRLLPYRDEQGRINVHLLQRSLDEIAAGAATCDAKTHANAKAWLRHGLQALAGHAAHRGSGPGAAGRSCCGGAALGPGRHRAEEIGLVAVVITAWSGM